MTDALNQTIHHKCEETLPCPADAVHPVPVLPFSLSAQDNANKVQMAQTMSLHKCYSKCCLNVLKVSL